MARYVLGKPLFIETPLWEDVEPHRPSLTVSDPKAVNTGLIARTGEPIMRVNPPIGFGRDGEW